MLSLWQLDTTGGISLTKISVSAGIVVYNGAQEALCAARSILSATKDTDLQLYLIDNASPDGSAKCLASAAPSLNAQVICLEQNIGFGSGHNTVLPLLNSRYHAVINPDITLNEDSISVLCHWLEQHPDVVMVTPRLHFPTGEEQFTAKRVPTFLALLSRQLPLPFLKGIEHSYLMLDQDLTVAQEIDFCTGCFFVIRTDVFRRMGGFDESYFMYVEDADLTRKAQAYGKVMYVPITAVTHAWHRDTRKKWRNFWMQVHSMLRYWRKWGFRFW